MQHEREREAVLAALGDGAKPTPEQANAALVEYLECAEAWARAGRPEPEPPDLAPLRERADRLAFALHGGPPSPRGDCARELVTLIFDHDRTAYMERTGASRNEATKAMLGNR